MPKPTVRNAQLISPFGVGSLCEVDGQSFFIRGTGSWERGYNLQRVEIASLEARIRPRKLMKPRDSVAIARFPRWHFCPQCRQMTFYSHQRDEDERSEDGSLAKPRCSSPECSRARLVPMRFVAVCDNGHLDEIDWYWWAHRTHQSVQQGQCDRREAQLKFKVTGKSGGDFSSMEIACDCGASGDLEGIADGPLPQRCHGRQPGEQPGLCVAQEGDGQPAKLFMEPRGSSALHYASVISAIDIAGDADSESWEKLRSDAVFQGLVQAGEALFRAIQNADLLRGTFEEQVAQLASQFGLPSDEAWACFVADVTGETDENGNSAQDEFDQESILGEEFPVLCDPAGQATKWLITRPEMPGNRFGLDRLLERVVRVERLREVRAFRGFQRRNVTDSNATISPSLDRAQPNWLPAIQVLGEGIFLQFKKEAIKTWLNVNGDTISSFTAAQLEKAEELGLPARMGFNATPAFIMVHTFSHLLINQLSFDCGYSSTSLRERIYCGAPSNPYAGILIFTADSDSEGSMGGLSEMAAADRISDVIYRAIARSQWCSGDPVCRELDAQGVDGLNRAACHACSLVAETSCTCSNVLLNRVLVAGEGKMNGRKIREPIGFFSSVLEG